MAWTMTLTGSLYLLRRSSRARLWGASESMTAVAVGGGDGGSRGGAEESAAGGDRRRAGVEEGLGFWNSDRFDPIRRRGEWGVAGMGTELKPEEPWAKLLFRPSDRQHFSSAHLAFYRTTFYKTIGPFPAQHAEQRGNWPI